MSEEYIGIKIVEDNSEVGYDSPSHNVAYYLGGNLTVTGTVSSSGGGSSGPLFKIDNATLDASGVTTAKTYVIPNTPGTLALLSNIPVVPTDGTFTTYTKVHDVVVDGAGLTNPINVTAASIDETNGWVTFIENGTGNDRLVTCKFDGTSKATLYSGGSPYNLGLGPNVCQSAGGTIQVWADGNDNYYVSSKGALIHTINTSGILASDVGLAISITGKYVFIVGDNGSQEARFQIWQGS